MAPTRYTIPPSAIELSLRTLHAYLVPERQQLDRLRACGRLPDQRQVEQPTDDGVDNGENHRARGYPPSTRRSPPAGFLYPTAYAALIAFTWRAASRKASATGRSFRVNTAATVSLHTVFDSASRLKNCSVRA